MSELELQKNQSLKSYNTLGIEAACDYFYRLTDQQQLPELLAYAEQEALPVTVLGGGSNIILKQAIKGLVVYMQTRGIAYEQKNDTILVTAQAGENWHEFVLYCHQQGFYGLENLALIPGTCGAAAIQNIGAYGVELADVFHSVTVWDKQTQQWQVLQLEDCQFAYRDSIFKTQAKGRYVITALTVALSSKAELKTVYPALQHYFTEHNITAITPQHLLTADIAIRQSKLPDPTLIPNAGSFFKNPIVTVQQCEELLKAYPTMPHYDVDASHKKLAAGWLLDQAGWKGKTVGAITMHHQQALVLTNKEGTGQEVLAVAAQIQADIKQQYQINLEIEPIIVGE